MWTRSLAAILLLAMLTPGAAAQVRDPAAVKPDGWCQTEVQWLKKGLGGFPVTSGGCPIQGSCDTPAVRDANIPTGAGVPLLVRVKVNVFREDDGSNPATTLGLVADQITQLNADYAPYQIQFTLTGVTFINDSTYRTLDVDNAAAKAALKTAYADSPGTQCNVYVTTLLNNILGEAVFPWDPGALTNQGGVLVEGTAFGTGQKTLTHEMGHALGLWHTHRLDEVTPCSACYERADGANADTTGDYCSDTPPTPTNFQCNDPAGNDPCSGVPWAPTQPQNFMGYAPDACYTMFTNQQAGRLHCWTTGSLLPWLEAYCPGNVSVECCLTVCAIDPSCCDTLWDQDCIDIQLAQCAGCGAGDSGSCFLANGTEGCEDGACCATVCAVDPHCCGDGGGVWDASCADLAAELCWGCGLPASGSCYANNGSVGCDDLECCASVCLVDPYCCETAWDDFCADGTIGLCPPENDLCADALPLGDGLTTFHTFQATHDFGLQCDGYNIRADIWFDYVADFTGDLQINACFDAVPQEFIIVAAYDGCACPAGDGNLIACDSGFCSLSAEGVVVPVVQGQCIKIRIGSAGTPYHTGYGWVRTKRLYPACGDPASGPCGEPNGTPGCDNGYCCDEVCNLDPFCCEGTWDASCVTLLGQIDEICATPSNDDCADAIALTSGQIVSIYNNLASTDGPQPCGQIGRDLWYTFVPGTDGMLQVSTCGSGYDTVLAVYDGCACPPGLPSLLDCNDDFCGVQSQVSVPVLAGNCYLIQVGGFDGDWGNGLLQASLFFGEPGSDLCEDAPPAFAGTVAFSNELADDDGPAPLDCDSMTLDVWWDYTAPCSGEVTVSLCDDTNFDTMLVVYEGCGCPLSDADAIACNDDECSVQSEVTFSAVGGQCYKIQVGGYDYDSGVGTMTIIESNPGPTCPGDFDGSGTVDIVDLLGVLSAWGSNDPTYDIAPDCGDGTVNIQDLLAVLAAWGGCP